MLRILVSVAVIGLLSVPSVAAAQAPPVPVAPADGQVFAWADVDANGVQLVVEAPQGLDFLTVDVARDPGLTVFADVVTLFEESPGRYEGTAITLLFDPEQDPGAYYWQASYYWHPDDPLAITGPVRSFVIGGPDAAPSVQVGLPAKLLAGRQTEARLRYQPGASPGSDRLHLIDSRSPCPAAPDAQAGRVLVDGAAPPATGELRVPVRYRRPGRVRLCAYVTAGASVAARASDSADVVPAPAKPERMLGWRLGPRGLGPVRIGMKVAAVERVTGHKMILVSGEHPSCRLWRLRGAPNGLSLMVARGRLARVEAYRGRWRSSRGIRIGDRARKVTRRHPGVRSRPHPYVMRGRYLIAGARRRMIFETGPGGRVTSFRGGRAREVAYIEGCA
jgi:hypothetical protein